MPNFELTKVSLWNMSNMRNVFSMYCLELFSIVHHTSPIASFKTRNILFVCLFVFWRFLLLVAPLPKPNWSLAQGKSEEPGYGQPRNSWRRTGTTRRVRLATSGGRETSPKQKQIAGFLHESMVHEEWELISEDSHNPF